MNRRYTADEIEEAWKNDSTPLWVLERMNKQLAEEKNNSETAPKSDSPVCEEKDTCPDHDSIS